MPDSNILSRIQSLGEEIIPAVGHLYLYGSRARGDFKPDSDWDLLILLNKDEEEFSDFDNYSYPFVEKGWDIGEDIRPHAYTRKEWFEGPHAMFYFNVEEDKKVLYEFKCDSLYLGLETVTYRFLPQNTLIT